jgi:hypothetical protein
VLIRRGIYPHLAAGSSRHITAFSVGRPVPGPRLQPATTSGRAGRQLEGGVALLRAKVTGKFYAAIDNGESWAQQLALRNMHNWDAGRAGFHADPALLADGRAGKSSIHVDVQFVVPSPQPEDESPHGYVRARPTFCSNGCCPHCPRSRWTSGKTPSRAHGAVGGQN